MEYILELGSSRVEFLFSIMLSDCESYIPSCLSIFKGKSYHVLWVIIIIICSLILVYGFVCIFNLSCPLVLVFYLLQRYIMDDYRRYIYCHLHISIWGCFLLLIFQVNDIYLHQSLMLLFSRNSNVSW